MKKIFQKLQTLPKPVAWSALALGIGLALLAALIALFPLQGSQWRTEWDLRGQGAARWNSGPLTGWQQDFCGSKASVPDPRCECVALVHGLGDNALTWKKILSRDSKSWGQPVRLVAVDLPGSGLSAPVGGAEALRAENLGALLADALRADSRCARWVLVGNSWGGWLSVWAALHWPEGIRKLLLVAPAGMRPSPGQALPSWVAQPSVESLKEFQSRAYASPRPLPEAVWRAAVARLSAGGSLQVLQSQQDRDYLDEVIGSVRAPTLFLWGAADRIIPAAKGRLMAEKMRGASFREAPACGHLPQKECPEVVAGAIREVLGFGAF